MSCLVSHSSSSIPPVSPCEKKKKSLLILIDSSTFNPHISDHEPSSQGNDIIHTPPPILDSEIRLGPGPPNHDQFISDKSHSNTNHDYATPNHPNNLVESTNIDMSTIPALLTQTLPHTHTHT